MTEHESEIRTLEEIVENPQLGDRLRGYYWKNYIEYKLYKGRPIWRLYDVSNEKFYSYQEAKDYHIILINGFCTKNNKFISCEWKTVDE